MKFGLFGIGLMCLGAIACGILPFAASMTNADERVEDQPTSKAETQPKPAPRHETAVATFGGGCFWCVEAVFQELKGVEKIVPGYAGGKVPNPTYQQVCTGTTGHAEVAQITYDPKVISYPEMLEVFWKTHDPTTLNRQGNDVGPQYRSIILYHDEAQKQAAESIKAKLNESGAFDRPIVTEIVPLTKFYPAEDYHHDYYRLNPQQPYCQYVIVPKLEKFRKAFPEKRKD